MRGEREGESTWCLTNDEFGNVERRDVAQEVSRLLQPQRIRRESDLHLLALISLFPSPTKLDEPAPQVSYTQPYRPVSSKRHPRPSPSDASQTNSIQAIPAPRRRRRR